MILADVHVTEPDDETDNPFIVFEFDDGNLAFECPIGYHVNDIIKAMREFLNSAEILLHSNLQMH
jgi:hypothetical protein